MKKKLYFFILLSTVFTGIATYGQRKIENSKRELNSKKSSTNSSTSNASSSSEVNGGGIIFQAVGYVFVGIVRYGLIGNYRIEPHLFNELTPYPFFKPKAGNFYNPEGSTVPQKFFRFDVENHFIYNSSSLFGNHIEAKIRPFQYIHLQADYIQLFERSKLEDTASQLSLYYFNIGYDRVRTERFNLGWTLGASYIGNNVKKTGFSYGLNAEYFFAKKISLSAEAKWSSINYSPVNSYKFQTKSFSKNHFIAIGYERLKIGSPKYNFVTLGAGIYF